MEKLAQVSSRREPKVHVTDDKAVGHNQSGVLAELNLLFSRPAQNVRNLTFAQIGRRNRECRSTASPA